jgi:transposase
MDELPLLGEPPPAGLSTAAWAATPLEVRTAFLAMHTQLRDLQFRITDLEARLNQHSGNSSKPPSSDPPSAPPRPARVPRGRQRGGQPGHPGHHRPLVPPEDVDYFVPVVPPQCCQCQAALDPTLPNVREPERRQVYEIPPIEPEITEYQLRAVQCPHCGQVTRADLPPGAPPGGYGPRTIAVANLFHGRFRLSDHETAELMQDVFGVPMAEGTVTTVEATMSAALESSYRAVETTTRTQTRLNLDETSWKQGAAGTVSKRKGWLWVAVTHICTLFLIWGKRDGAALDAMLGAAWRGIITSDRWSVYKRFLREARQLCWAHLKRDMTAFFEYARDGPVHDWGAQALAQIHLMFVLWHSYQAGELDRGALQCGMASLQAAFHDLLEAGKDVPLEKVRSLSRDLLALEPALWTFVREEGVEPTNNAAERALRPAVLWRKGCFGTQSDAGSRYVERMLTVIATCRQQNRHLLTFLTESVEAYQAGTPPPQLIQTP